VTKTAAPSAGRKKLSVLGVPLPAIPVTNVGSFPKTPELIELRYKVSKGVQPVQELERKERLATEMTIRDQERLGLDVLVDGEMNRADLVSFFARRIDGFGPGGTVRVFGNRYYKKPVIRGKLSWTGPMVAESWKANQRLTHRPLKAVITGPYTLMDWSFNEYYPSRESALRDLADILKREVAALSEAGARLIQIDEPAISSRPEEFAMAADAIREVIGSSRAYITLHHCYGNLAPLWTKLQRLPVDNFSIECANSDLELLKEIKKNPTVKDVTVGLLDVHNHKAETPETVRTRLKAALASVPAGQLWVSPDCGLRTRDRKEVHDKLSALIKETHKVRGRLRA
jgi:5-methyltetrahydropteroyltriglutamate--homocysteine methyltransferase